MNVLNGLLTRVVDLLLAPFASLPATGLFIYAVPAGVLMTFVFAKTSNQRRLRAVADCTRAQLLAIKLFKDDLLVMLRCQKELLQATGWRLVLSIPPMLVLVIPFALLLTHLAVHYQHEPLRPGQSTVVTVEVAPEAWPQWQDIECEPTDRIAIESQAMRDVQRHTVHWRVRPVAPGPAVLRFGVGSKSVQKQLTVAGDAIRLAPVSVRRPGAGFLDRLLHPAEAGFARGFPVRAIEVRHEPRSMAMLGIRMPWWAGFLIVSMLAALVAGRLMGVQF